MHRPAQLRLRRLVLRGAGTAAQRRQAHQVEIGLPPDLEIAVSRQGDRVTPCHQVTLAGGEKAVVFVDREQMDITDAILKRLKAD